MNWTSEQYRKHAEKKISKKPKYGNQKIEVHGVKFDSKREAGRYVELKMMQSAGEIYGLQLQVPFVLAPSVKLDGKNKPALRYFADFVYFKTGTNEKTVEDAKGKVTDVYRIKKHLMKSVHNIEIKEV